MSTITPQNRRITGVPGGEATQFKPGQSGNPGGRPKRKPITEALEKVFTPEQCLAVAEALLEQAKKDSISHVQEAANRLEGRVEAADEGRLRDVQCDHIGSSATSTCNRRRQRARSSR